MPAVFKTLGPFELGQTSGDVPLAALSGLWKSPHHENGCIPRPATGVYVLAVRRDQNFLPIYVGKSDLGFAPRLNNHHIFAKVAESFPHEDVFLFLIARVTPKKGQFITRKRVLSRKSGKRVLRKARANSELEFLLIGACLKLNPELLNKQEISFLKGLSVPGYTTSPTLDDDAATAFSKMLKL